MPDTPAGTGEHALYRIGSAASGDTARLTARNHYIGVEAVAWFINEQSGWLSKKMASGTLTITLASGLETYEAALGTFALEHESRTAPVFAHEVLKERNYLGGSLTFAASLTMIKKDSAIAGLLKSAAAASLGVVSGMVETATLAGPATILSAAGSDIIGGVRNLLDNTGEDRKPLFDFSGLVVTLKPEEMQGPVLFLLLHRGARLDQSKLKVQNLGTLQYPFYDDAPLTDGAWLLLRVKRSDEYTGVRQWFRAAQLLRTRLSNLVDDVASGILQKEEALKEFITTPGGDRTVVDEFVRLRSVIQDDGVLSERETNLHIGQLRLRVDAAKRAVSDGKRATYDAAIAETAKSIEKGAQPPRVVADAIIDEARAVANRRLHTVVADTSFRRVASMSPAAMLSSFQYMPRMLAEYSSDADLPARMIADPGSPTLVIRHTGVRAAEPRSFG